MPFGDPGHPRLRQLTPPPLSILPSTTFEVSPTQYKYPRVWPRVHSVRYTTLHYTSSVAALNSLGSIISSDVEPLKQPHTTVRNTHKSYHHHSTSLRGPSQHQLPPRSPVLAPHASRRLGILSTIYLPPTTVSPSSLATTPITRVTKTRLPRIGPPVRSRQSPREPLESVRSAQARLCHSSPTESFSNHREHCPSGPLYAKPYTTASNLASISLGSAAPLGFNVLPKL